MTCGVARLLVALILLHSQLRSSVSANEAAAAALHRVQRSARVAAGELETYLLVYDVSPDLSSMPCHVDDASVACGGDACLC